MGYTCDITIFYQKAIKHEIILPMTKNLRYFLLIALLIHLIVLFCFSISLTNQNLSENATVVPPNLPAYVYREEKNNPIKPMPKAQTQISQETSKLGINKSHSPTPVQTSTSEPYSLKKGEQNINLLLKASKNMNNALLNILTKTLASHLSYPKIAMDFRLRGVAIIGFFLGTDGQISQVTLLHSSGSTMLDQAAMDAVKSSSPIKKIEAYVKQPTPLAIRIIFD